MPAGVTRGEVRRDGRVIRWVESGHGEPVVVLDAAAAEPGSLAWAGVMPLVAARTRVIAYDRAGAGDSDPVAPLSLDGQIGDLTAVLQAAGGGRPVVVAGHSWGGLLAQLVALDHPELVSGLVLVDPADENYLDPPPRASRTAWPWANRCWPGTPAASWPACPGRIRAVRPAPHRRSAGPGADPGRLRPLLREADPGRHGAERTSADRRLAPTIQQRRAESPPLAMPVILFSATTGQPPPERERYTAFHAALIASLPAGQHVVLADTTHAMNQERPAELAEAIISLLGRP